MKLSVARKKKKHQPRYIYPVTDNKKLVSVTSAQRVSLIRYLLFAHVLNTTIYFNSYLHSIIRINKDFFFFILCTTLLFNVYYLVQVSALHKVVGLLIQFSFNLIKSSMNFFFCDLLGNEQQK